MNVYRISRVVDDLYPAWEGDRTRGHAVLKGCKGMPDARLELVKVDTSKDALLQLLKGNSDLAFEVLQTWMLTPRGGLKEVPNGE